MARRQRKPEDIGPAVPRWVVEFRAEDWPGGAGEWCTAVGDWAKENLYRRGHYAAWIDVTANKYRVRSRAWA